MPKEEVGACFVRAERGVQSLLCQVPPKEKNKFDIKFSSSPPDKASFGLLSFPLCASLVQGRFGVSAYQGGRRRG